jgi:hypothetical protein
MGILLECKYQSYFSKIEYDHYSYLVKVRFDPVLKYTYRRDGELIDRVSGGQPAASFNAADINRGRPACGRTVSTFVSAMETTGPPGRRTPTVPDVAENTLS